MMYFMRSISKIVHTSDFMEPTMDMTCSQCSVGMLGGYSAKSNMQEPTIVRSSLTNCRRRTSRIILSNLHRWDRAWSFQDFQGGIRRKDQKCRVDLGPRRLASSLHS